jgi:hypothetical protein
MSEERANERTEQFDRQKKTKPSAGSFKLAPTCNKPAYVVYIGYSAALKIRCHKFLQAPEFY